jgi:hypothetical protein
MHWSDPSVVITIIIAAVTLLYTVLTGLIWYATWQNTKATREVLEASHRPYVGVIHAELTGKVMGVPPTVAISIANAGTIPSRQVKVDFDIRTASGSRRVSASDNFIALFPGRPVPATFQMSESEFPQCLQAGFEVVVEVHYKGVTDREYTTRCTFSYTGVHEGFALSAGDFD